MYAIDSKILDQFDVYFDNVLKIHPVDNPYTFSYVEFSGESENQLENVKFLQEKIFFNVLLNSV